MVQRWEISTRSVVVATMGTLKVTLECQEPLYPSARTCGVLKITGMRFVFAWRIWALRQSKGGAQVLDQFFARAVLDDRIA